jgi:hypothetical protein
VAEYYYIQKRNAEHSGCRAEFRVESEKYKYKGIINLRITIMEHVFVYGYVSFALRVLFLIGLIFFMWFALRKICNVLHRWVIVSG